MVVGSVDLYLNEIQTASHTPQLSLYVPISARFLLTVAGRRGSRPWGKVLYGHTWLETPDPVRSPKLSNHRRVQYSGGGPPGKRTYCTALNIFYFFEFSGPEAGPWSDLRISTRVQVLCQLNSLISILLPAGLSLVDKVWLGAWARGPERS